MRADQFEVLIQRREALIDLFLRESDPTTWPGYGQALMELSQADRGDQVWSKKSAAATLMLATRISSLVDMERRSARDVPPGPDDPPPALPEGTDDIETEIERYANEARKLLNRAARSGV